MQTFRRSGFLMILFLAPFFVHAEVYINEIMYDPVNGSSHEWLEIHNSGNEPVDLTDWRFFNSLEVSAPLRLQSGPIILSPDGYAIITKTLDDFVSDHASFSGTIFTSSQFTLPNNSDTSDTYKAISDSDKQIINSVVYDTAVGENKEPGNSLQRHESEWITAEPTPGALNATENSEPIEDSENNGNTSTTTDIASDTKISSHYSYVPLSDFESVDDFSVSAGRERMSVVGVPVEFEAERSVEDGRAEYPWNFGDGYTDEGEIVEHSYQYAGEYVVVLDGKENNDRSVSRTTVEVVDPQVSIEEANERLIRLRNNSKDEINLYGFELRNNSERFEFPKDTIILPETSTVFSAEVTKLHPESISSLSIENVQSEKIIYNGHLSSDAKLDQSEIRTLVDEALEIQKKIALLPNENQTEQTAVESLPVENVSAPNRVDPSNVAASVLSLPSPSSVSSSTSSTPEKIENSWIETIKHFFLGQ